MQDKLRSKLETLGRVRDFIREHPFSEPDDSALAVRFDELLTRARTLVVQEHGRRLDVAVASRRRRDAAKALDGLIHSLSRLGKFASRQYPELGARFHGPESNSSNALFLTKAWELLKLARKNREPLAMFGLDGAEIDEVATLINRFEAAAEKANAGKRAQVGARAEMVVITGELMDLVSVLDGLNQNRFGDRPEILESWNSVRDRAYLGSSNADPLGDGPPPSIGASFGKAA